MLPGQSLGSPTSNTQHFNFAQISQQMPQFYPNTTTNSTAPQQIQFTSMQQESAEDLPVDQAEEAKP